MEDTRFHSFSAPGRNLTCPWEGDGYLGPGWARVNHQVTLGPVSACSFYKDPAFHRLIVVKHDLFPILSGSI